MSSDLLVKCVGLLGLYDDRPNKPENVAACCAHPLADILKVVFLATDFISTALDWQIVLSLARGNFKLVWADASEEANANVSRYFTLAFVVIMVISHLIFLRGKWFYLMNNRDWVAFSMTEVVLYTLEDVAAIELYLIVDGFYSNDRFVDRLNVLISNFTGYLVVGILWYRMCSCQQRPRPPCSAYIFPSMVIVLTVLVSLASYVSLFQGSFKEAFEGSGDDGVELSAAVLFPLAAGAWAALLFLYILVLVCCWDRCLQWTTRTATGGQQQAGTTMAADLPAPPPSVAEEDNPEAPETIGMETNQDSSSSSNDSNSSSSNTGHSKTYFVLFWTLIFLLSFVLGFFLADSDDSENDVTDINSFRWVPSFDQSDLKGEVPEDAPAGTILYFGHTVDWDSSGDKNGFGSTLRIGAADPTGNIVAYIAATSLRSQTSYWETPQILSTTENAYVMASSPAGSVRGGFYTNASGTFGWASIALDFHGPFVPEDGQTRYHVSVDVGGESMKEFKTRFNVKTIVTDENSVRRVAGFPYALNSTGMVRAGGPWEIAKCTYASFECICKGGSRDCTRTKFVEYLGDAMYGKFPGEEFGRQVSIGNFDSSNLAIASSRRVDANSSGSVTLMHMPFASTYGQQLNWSPMEGSPLESDQTDDKFAHSIEMSADAKRLIVGAPEAGGGGAAYVYEYKSDIWTLHNVLTPFTGNETRAVQNYGYAVSIDSTGRRVAVAGETNDASYVYVYQNIQSNQWTPIGGIIEGGAPGNYASGYATALSLDYDGIFLAIGDVGDGDSAGLGRVRIFKFTQQYT